MILDLETKSNIADDIFRNNKRQETHYLTMTEPPSYEMSTISASRGSLQTSGINGPAHFDVIAQVDDPTVKKTTGPTYENPGYIGDDKPTTSAGFASAAQPTQPSYDHAGPSTSGGGGGTSVWHTGQNTTVVVNQPMARPGPIEQVHAPHPIPTVCFNCHERIMTYIYYQTGCCTWVACVGLMMAGCDLGCCLLPFCFDYFKDSVHKCPKCHCILGKYKKL